jgi:hypothetical protein
MQKEKYLALPLKPINTPVIELQVFFDELFKELTKITPSQILDANQTIIAWKESVAKAKFKADEVYARALTFYERHSETYEDIHRTTSHRLLRSAMNTLSFFGNSPSRLIASGLTSGTLASLAIFFGFSQNKIKQQAALLEEKTLEKDIVSGQKMTTAIENIIDIDNEDIQNKQANLLEAKQEMKSIIDKISKYESDNEFHQNDEVLGLLKVDRRTQSAIITGATSALTNALKELQKTIKNQGGLEIAITNKLPTAQEMAHTATESLTDSSIVETLTSMLPTIAFGGFVVASVLGLSAICSRHNRQKQLKALNINISAYVNTFHLQMLASDYNRKLIDDKFKLDQQGFQNLLEFQENLKKYMQTNKELQTHDLISKCRVYRNTYHKVDFLRFYYYLRRFMTSNYGWTETECDTTHKLFFDEVFEELNAKRASKKYNESNGVYDGEFEPFIPMIENQEPLIPLVLHVQKKKNMREEKKETQSKFSTIENLEQQAKIEKQNGTDVYFWTTYINNNDPFVLQYLGNKIWGEDKWIYLQAFESINETKNSFDNNDIFSLKQKLNEDENLMVKHIWEGFSSSVSELLLPSNYHKLRTDRSLFYYQSRIDKNLKFIAQRYITIIMLNYIEFFNIEFNEFFNREIYILKFEDLITNFFRDSGLLPTHVIVFALRALTPTVIETHIIDALLYKMNEKIQFQFIQLGDTILELYDGKPSLESDGSNSFTSEPPSSEFTILKLKQFDENAFEERKEQPLKKLKDKEVEEVEEEKEPNIAPRQRGQKRAPKQPAVVTSFSRSTNRGQKLVKLA